MREPKRHLIKDQARGLTWCGRLLEHFLGGEPGDEICSVCTWQKSRTETKGTSDGNEGNAGVRR